MRRAMKTGAQTLHLSCRRCIIGWVWVQSESSPSSCSLYTKSGFVPYRTHGLSPLAITSPTWTRMQARTTGDGPKHCPPQPDAPWPMAHAKTQPCCPALCPHGYPVHTSILPSTRCALDALRMPSRAASAQCGVASDRLQDARQVSVVCVLHIICVVCHAQAKERFHLPVFLSIGTPCVRRRPRGRVI
jgi:hypothetical protein